MKKTDPLILYVDDDVANRVVFEQSFKNRFRLEVLDSGEAALRRLGEVPIAVVLTDQRMPGMTGNELLTQVRLRSPETVGIVITAYDDVEPILDAVNSGFVGRYIVKPWAAQDIVTAVRWGLEIYDIARKKLDLELKLLEGERFTTLGAICAGLMHDMNQPLSILSANLENMEELADAMRALGNAVSAGQMADVQLDGRRISELAGEFPDAVRDARVAAQQVAAVAESALRFLSSGRRGPARGETSTAARYTVTLCAPQVRKHGGILSHDIPADLPMVAMTTSALTQIMVNLVVNAAHALADRPHGQVELTLQPEGAGVVLCVRDNGTGMSPEVLSHVREPFFTTKAPGIGTGLGLYNTQRLVDDAKGQLSITSIVGEGTKIRIWLPAAEP